MDPFINDSGLVIVLFLVFRLFLGVLFGLITY
jgi:hypothetical protein